MITDSTKSGRITIGGSLAGDIDIDAASGLAGQIIINALNTSDTWTGKVDIGSSPLRLWASSSSPDIVPHYTRSLSSYGGSAVGEWPTLAANSDRETIRLVFYGPVFDGGPTESPNLPPVIVRRTVYYYEYGQPIPPWEDITADCDITIAPAGFPREVWISPKDTAPLDGTFGLNHLVAVRLRSSTTGELTLRDLRCAGTLVSPAPEVMQFPESQTVDAQTVHEYRATLSAD